MAGGLDSYTKLLLHCDGADASTTFTDSATAKAVTAEGNAQIDTTQKVFGTASGLFDGTGDYLTVPDHADWDFGSGDFTIDFRARWASLPGNNTAMSMFGRYLSPANRMYGYAYNSSGTYQLALVVGDVLIEVVKNTSLSTNTWYHIALVRNGSNFLWFQDGVQVGTTSVDADAIPDFDTTFDIGKSVAHPLHNGWIDEFRVSKGIARWTANFTPPVSAYSKAAAGGLGIGNPYIF